VFPALAAAQPSRGLGREGSDLLQLPRHRYYPVRSVYCSTHPLPAADIRLWSRHSREFSVLRLSHHCFAPAVNSTCLRAGARVLQYPKALSTANAGDWAENVNRASKQGTWRSILDAMGAAQGSATKKSKQGLCSPCVRRNIRMRCFPIESPESRSPTAIGTDTVE
jgi:hypothetical protein